MLRHFITKTVEWYFLFDDASILSFFKVITFRNVTTFLYTSPNTAKRETVTVLANLIVILYLADQPDVAIPKIYKII